MTMKNLSKLAILSITLVTNTYALDLGHDVSLKGFGTIGFVNNNNNSADFVANNYSQPSGAGRSENFSLNPDSRIGLQMDWQATPKLSISSQAVSKQGPDNSYVPDLQLAFAKYKLLADLDIRAGRIRPPFFMLSDYLDMYYANPWIRPPTEFYTMVPMASHIEGVDLLYRPQTGPVSWLIQPYYGNTQLTQTKGISNDIQDLVGINVSGNYDDFTLRANYTHMMLTNHYPLFQSSAAPLLSSLCIFSSAACNEENVYSLKNKSLSIISFGANWDNGDYFISGEIGKRISENNVLDTTAGYISGGARFGKFTPYVTYSSSVNNSPTNFNGGTGRVAATVNKVVTTIMTTANYGDQDTKTLGIRYDFYKNLDLKIQWDRIDTNTNNGQANTGYGVFINPTTSFANSNNSIDLFSVATDFVF